MDQAYRLMRATCVYCNRFRLARVELNRFYCKLRLIRYGLLAEAEELEDVGLRSDEGAETDAEDIMEKRLDFVKRCLKKAGVYKRGSEAAIEFTQTEVIAKARKAEIEKFQADIVKTRKCASCKG